MKSYKLLLADISDNFQNKCIETYKFDPVCFLSAPRLTWQVSLKNIEIELELVTNADMLQMVGKIIEGGIFHAIL